MQSIKLHQDLYTAYDATQVVSVLFPGWTRRDKMTKVFKAHSQYEVMTYGNGKNTRYYIRKEKLHQLIKDIKKGEIK